MAGGFTSFLRAFYDRLFKYAWKFGVVGAVGWIIDFGIFNWLLGNDILPETLAGAELWAAVISVTVATVATWFGNRYWAFREHRRKNFGLEFAEFVVTSAIGLGIQTLCLWFSHYVLGLTDIVSDNIAKSVVGVVFALIFRFLMYRFVVFSPARRDSQSRLDREAAERASEERAGAA